MKTQTGWDGMKLVAESEEDEELLRKLFDSFRDSRNYIEMISPERSYAELKFYITLY